METRTPREAGRAIAERQHPRVVMSAVTASNGKSLPENTFAFRNKVWRWICRRSSSWGMTPSSRRPLKAWSEEIVTGRLAKLLYLSLMCHRAAASTASDECAERTYNLGRTANQPLAGGQGSPHRCPLINLSRRPPNRQHGRSGKLQSCPCRKISNPSLSSLSNDIQGDIRETVSGWRRNETCSRERNPSQ